MLGYTGKLLFVNLTDHSTEVRKLSDDLAMNFVGGPSLGAKILYEEMPANTDAFAPESVIGFVSGPANGTGPLIGGRYTVVCKSPVTGGWNDANSGGNFGAFMRKSGYDAIFVKGISPKPVYLFVENGKIEFRDASSLWGKTTLETEKIIKEEHGATALSIALIGPGGEKLSNMACVMNDSHRAAGRGGCGAVMGSKNLKAIACKGNLPIELKDKDAVLSLNKEAVEFCKGPMAFMVNMFGNGGTAAMYEGSVLSSDAGIKNWSGHPSMLSEKQVKALTAGEMDPRYKRKKFACNACSLGCGAMYEIKDGKWPVEDTGRPEYETLGAFGSLLMNGDPESVNYCNYLCNEYGYDTISFGSTVAWIMECYNNGLFTLDEMNGIDLTWGNADAIVQISEAICKGEGIGLILNKASRGAARHFNKGFEYLVDASGIEIPQHDARLAPGFTRTYQYDPTPGRHVKGSVGLSQGRLPPEQKYVYEGTGESDVEAVVSQEIINMSGFCSFSSFGLPQGHTNKYLTALTGVEYTPDDLKKLGLRSYTIRHAFNLREGMSRKDFTLSDRMAGKPALKEGPLAGVTIDNEKLADNFFTTLGWDLETLKPSKEFLENIGGLEDVINEIYG